MLTGIKPHIKLMSGEWYCSGDGCVGFGPDMKQAYINWCYMTLDDERGRTSR